MYKDIKIWDNKTRIPSIKSKEFTGEIKKYQKEIDKLLECNHIEDEMKLYVLSITVLGSKIEQMIDALKK